MNNHGQVVGEAWSNSYPTAGRAVLWESQFPIDIWPGTAPIHYGSIPRAYGINDSGDAVIDGNFDAFLYRGGKMISLSGTNGWWISARDINNDGLITGVGSTHLADFVGFVFDSKANKPPVRLELPGFEGCAINNAGQVAGLTWPGDFNHRAHFYSDGNIVDLGSAWLVSDLNDVGQIVGSREFEGNSHRTAFLCDTSNKTIDFQDLGTLSSLGHLDSMAWGINNHGDIVGQSQVSEASGWPHAFICRANSPMQDLNSLVIPSSGWTLLCSASAINDRGQIAGYGYYNGQERAFLLTPRQLPTGVHGSATFEYENVIGQLYSLVAGSAGVWFGPGTRPGPIDPEGRLWQLLGSEGRDVLVASILSNVANSISDVQSRDALERAVREIVRRALERLGERIISD